MANKQTIKINKPQLRKLIKESVRNIISEMAQVMDDFQLDRFCERNPDCGCRCMQCPAFAANQRFHLGYYDDEDEDMYESRLRRIVSECTAKILNEEIEEGTPKQNVFLKKLMGDRWKDEYVNLSVSDTSSMIDKELSNQPSNGQQYEVVEALGEEKITVCNTFYEAKKKFKEILDEMDETGWFRDPDLQVVRMSDVCYKVYGRNSRMCLGSIFIRKKK